MLSRLFFRFLSRIIFTLAPSKRLPARYWASGINGSREPELNYIESFVSTKNVAIDVGANEGLYTYRMSEIFDRVYAFDANTDVLKEIKFYNCEKITIYNKGLSSSEKEMIFYIPVLNGFPLTGWASVQKGNFPEAQEFIERKIEVLTLDSFKFESVSFIKIDVEGHELDVLLGARKTIIDNHPVILIEVREKNRALVNDFMFGIGYTQRTLRDYVNKGGSEGNFIYEYIG